jgi:hypothetical protein
MLSLIYWNANFFEGFSAGGVFEVRVGGVGFATRESHLTAVLTVVGAAFDENEMPSAVLWIQMDGYCGWTPGLFCVAGFKLLAIALVGGVGCFAGQFFFETTEHPISFHITKLQNL